VIYGNYLIECPALEKRAPFFARKQWVKVMAIVLTAKEAAEVGFKKADGGQIASVKSAGKGTQIANPQSGYICYIGPCEPGTGMRLVC
jgi:hypothetical protein